MRLVACNPRRLQRTETCVILSYLLFFSRLRTGNHCNRSTAVEAPEHSRAVGGALCKSRKTVVRIFLRVQCCSHRLPCFFRCKQAMRLRLLCGNGDVACNGFRGAPEEQSRPTREQIVAKEVIFTVDEEVFVAVRQHGRAQRRGCGWLAKAQAKARVDVPTAPRQCCGFLEWIV